MHCVEGLGYTSKYGNLPKYFSFLHSHTFHIWKGTLEPETGHPTCVINHPLFFASFFWHSHTIHIWKCTLDPATAPSTLSSTIPYFFHDFPPILLPFFTFA
jgi:hypothetical protein